MPFEMARLTEPANSQGLVVVVVMAFNNPAGAALLANRSALDNSTISRGLHRLPRLTFSIRFSATMECVVLPEPFLWP